MLQKLGLIPIIIFICLFSLDAKGQKSSVPLHAKAYIKLSSGEVVNVGLDPTYHLPIYFTQGDFLPGTRYQIEIMENSFDYVYVIGSDQKNNAGVIFNPHQNLSFSSLPLFIPSSGSFITMDDTPGKDYITILFSNFPLNPEKIVESIINSPGNYYQKLEYALGPSVISEHYLRCVMNRLSFIAIQSDKIIPITFEMKHK